MSVNGYYESKDLYYSVLFGSGIYEWTGQNVQDPIEGDNGTGYLSPLVVNKITGEQFFLKRLDCGAFKRKCYSDKILLPPDRDRILWPSDIVDLTGEQLAQCNLLVAKEYSDEQTPPQEKDGTTALLFPYGGYPKMISAERRLKQISEHNWKNPQIREMAIQILKTMDQLNRQGYIYTDIHLSRLFFKEDGSVFLNFSNLLFSFEDCIQEERKLVCVFEEGEYPLEFAEPGYVQGNYNVMDFQTQNYSITALLFYLFFGWYAYDGRLLTGYTSDNLQRYYVKFREYHKMGIFVFDPKDSRNKLGIFEEEQHVVELWEECPELLKELFLSTLCEANATRSQSVFNPTPKTWLDCLEKIGWISGTTA